MGYLPGMRSPLALACMLLSLVACSEKLDEAQAKSKAEQIWNERCVTCHGVTGAGDGPGAKALVVKPRSFQDPKWQASVDNARIKQVIVHGGASVGLSEAMTPNLDLKDQDAVQEALVRKVRSLVQ